MLLKDFIAQSSRVLEPLYGAEEARAVVLVLCEAFLGTKNYTHIVSPEYAVDSGKQPALEAAMKRLAAGEPVQYVLGYSDFCGLRFKVDPSVLIPRPETEQMCRMAGESVARRMRMRRAFGKPEVKVLDLCTGSGCIAWSLAVSNPETRALGIDISEAAVKTARGQDFKAECKMEGVIRPVFVNADVLLEEGDDLPDSVTGWNGFDIIVSNPPYVRESEKSLMRTNVCDFEPALALFVPDDDPLKFYKAVAVWAGKVLAPDGVGYVEINEASGPDTECLFRQYGFSDVEVLKDFCGKNRFVKFAR